MLYEMPRGSWDVLLSDGAPSCYLTGQVAGKKWNIIIVLAIPVDTRAPRLRSFGKDVALDCKISSPASFGHCSSTFPHSIKYLRRSMSRPESFGNCSSTFPHSIKYLHRSMSRPV